MIGSVTEINRRQAGAPSTSAASSTSPGTLRKPAENTSIENATLRQRLAMQTTSIGVATRKLVVGVPSSRERVPPACENAYQMNAPVMVGSTQATMMTA